jgi:hypothetical protein
LAALSVVACGGDKSGDRDATGGSTGSGGSSAQGGSSMAGSTATGGAGGAVTLNPYLCNPAEALPTPDITSTIDPTGSWGDKSTYSGGSFTFGDADANSVVDISIDYANKSLHVTGKAATYTGFGLWFGPANKQAISCIDGVKSGGTHGVSFDITDNGGTVTEIKFSVQSHATSPIDTTNKRGACVYTSEASKYSDCVYPSATVAVPSGGGVVEVPWESFTGGKPVATTDGTELDGLQWQFPWMPPTTEYAVDVTIKDVKFY